MKPIIKTLLSVFLIFILAAAGGIFYLSRGIDTGKKLEINDVNLSAHKDGTYDGSYKGGRWSNEVKVTVKDHRITDIIVVKGVLLKRPGIAEELIGNVIRKQSLSVDTLSGATITSKAYLKAIENALRK